MLLELGFKILFDLSLQLYTIWCFFWLLRKLIAPSVRDIIKNLSIWK